MRVGIGGIDGDIDAAGLEDAELLTGPSAETCKRAMRAFRKRLAFTRLDDASRFSRHDPLSAVSDPP